MLKTEIICLQELNCNSDILNRYASYSLPGKKSLFSCSDTNSHESIGIYYSNEIKLLSFVELKKGRLLKAIFEKSDQTFTVYCVYNYTLAYVASNFELLQMLSQDLLLDENSSPTLVLGDFNINLNKETRPSFFLKNFISEHGLTDVTSLFSSPHPTWRGDGNRVASESRLDLILTKNFELTDLRFALLPVPTSDHSILVLEKRTFIPPPLLSTCTAILMSPC